MKDRHYSNKRRPLTVGVPAQPVGAIPLHKDGIEMDKGVPRGPESVHGIPTGPIVKSTGPAKCTATTKRGNPCKAYATETGLCAGHSKQ